MSLLCIHQNKTILLPFVLATGTLFASDSIGSAQLNVNLRYESVDQDNALREADALTLRTRFTYTFNESNGFSGQLEFEDSRSLLGINDYNDAIGQNTGIYSVIADPETTELDQAYLQYRQGDFKLKAGRQLIALDNHRYVGHVGWRQDRQTFDGLSLHYDMNDKTKFTYAALTQRNRIFAEERDIESKDHLLNVSYKSALGTVTGYGYLLEVDDNTANGIDTFGVSLKGNSTIDGTKALYHVEFATQSATSGSSDFDASYMLLEGGIVFDHITTSLGYEVLGSDGGDYGFSTPLATLHKFNGFADQFLATPDVGLTDFYLTLATNALGAKWSITYHDFSADESTAVVDDLGSEVDLVISKKLFENYTIGFKYAAYSAGDSAVGKVDTNKLWLWVSAQY